jgi:endonuclease YncB( thermonuclease family)
MTPDNRWKWAGIVSFISIGGVLITDVVANVISGYISEQIKANWQVPGQAPAAKDAAPPQAEAMVSSPAMAPSPQPQVTQPQVTMAAVTPHNAPAPASEIATAPEPLPEPEAEPEAVASPAPTPLPPEPQAAALTGTVEQVIDTGTLKIEGETIVLAGIKGLGSPYRDQLAKFIEEQGSQIRCTPSGDGHVCFVKNVDLALAALTNGAARLGAGATQAYQRAADEARRNRRGIFQ